MTLSSLILSWDAITGVAYMLWLHCRFRIGSTPQGHSLILMHLYNDMYRDISDPVGNLTSLTNLTLQQQQSELLQVRSQINDSATVHCFFSERQCQKLLSITDMFVIYHKAKVSFIKHNIVCD